MKYFILKWSLEKKQNNKTKRSLWCRLLHKMIVPLSANPDFDDKIEDVTLWFIEYDDVVNHIANREIGFAKDGRIIVKMPDDRNYGYWLDTNCELEDFKKMGINMITEKEFNDLWNSVYYDSSKRIQADCYQKWRLKNVCNLAFTDILGSILYVTYEKGTKVFDASYDAWGQADGNAQHHWVCTVVAWGMRC